VTLRIRDGLIEVLILERDEAREERDRFKAGYDQLTTARPRAEWTEADGDVLWWHFDETGYCDHLPFAGRPDDEETWNDAAGFYTHWSPLPRPGVEIGR